MSGSVQPPAWNEGGEMEMQSNVPVVSTVLDREMGAG